MLTHFRYYMRPEQIGRTLTVDEFLLKDRRGHCEYFAAGMVALLSALGQPARVVGGFYGGRLMVRTTYRLIVPEGLKPGRYHVRAEAPPGEIEGSTDVVLVAGQEAKATIRLSEQR